MSDPEITPSELRFRFQLGKTLPATINIHNPNSQRLAFKVKTTTPKKYCVKPSSGAVEAHGSAIIQVTMQASKELPTDLNNCKDKFLIQTMLLGAGEEVNPDAFKKDNKSVKDAKLKVILEGPPAPPSPVPEAAEGEEDGSVKELKTFQAATSASDIPTVGASLPAVTSKDTSAGQPSADKASTVLRSDYDRVERECRELRSKVERLQSQPRPPSTAAQPANFAKAMSLASEKKLALIQIILVAILAFLIGHFT